jgi:hypothetical protein
MTACILPTANATMTATAGMAALVRGESVLPTGFAATPDRWLYSADSTQPKKEKPKRSKNRSLFVLEVRVSRLLAGQSIYEDVPPVRPPWAIRISGGMLMNRPIIALAFLASLLLLPTSSIASQAGTLGSDQAVRCNPPYADCDGRANNGCETNTQTDVNNCGACGTRCSLPNATNSCVNSTCQVSACSAGYRDCDGNPANGCETNVQTNVNNCGACGTVCSFPNATSACVNSNCRLSACSAGYGDCDANAANGCETNVQSDVNNCGACGTRCSLPNATSACVNSSCQVSACSAGSSDCDANPANGCEIRIQTDPHNCGVCGRECQFPNATTGCAMGNCTIAACSAGYNDCDNIPMNGCEIRIQTDPRNCGACGRVCQLPNATTTCANGSCAIASCSAGYLDCNGMPNDGCETHANSCSP